VPVDQVFQNVVGLPFAYRIPCFATKQAGSFLELENNRVK